MGLFNKTVNCARCGKPFEKGILSGDKLCEECSWLDMKQRMAKFSYDSQVQGIKNYYQDMPKQFRTMPADINTIIASRNNTLEKYRRSYMMNIDILNNARKNFTGWNDEQMVTFSCQVLNALVSEGIFSSYNLGSFLVSHMYDGVVIEYDSVFAIAIEENFLLKAPAGEQAYLCHLFTNDPFFPVMGISFLPKAQSKGIFADGKRAKERVAVLQELLPKMFKNLTYPIVGCKELMNIIAQEGMVRGNISPQFMTTLLKKNSGLSPFWTSMIPWEMPAGISYAIQEYGYIAKQDVLQWLYLNDRSIANYWQPYMDRAAEEIDRLVDELRAAYNSFAASYENKNNL